MKVAHYKGTENFCFPALRSSLTVLPTAFSPKDQGSKIRDRAKLLFIYNPQSAIRNLFHAPAFRPGHLTLTHWDAGTAKATIEVPVVTSEDGKSPAIVFSPQYLADALAIGPTLRLIDEMASQPTSRPATSA